MSKTQGAAGSEGVSEQLKFYLEATVASSTRVRQVILVLVTISIIILVGTWNSTSYTGWQLIRTQALTEAERWIRLQESTPERTAYLAEIARLSSSDSAEEKALALMLEESDRRGRKAAGSLSEIFSHEQIKYISKKWRTMSIEHVSAVRVPFFGVIIDINDVSLLGGLALLVVVVWLHLSLWRHHSNLSSIFKAAKGQTLRFCYQYLSMTQVLTVPKPLDDSHAKLMPKRPWVKGLLLLPLFAQVFGLLAQGLTLPVLSRIDRVPLGLFHIGAGMVMTVMIAVMTLRCMTLRREIMGTWDEAKARLSTQRES